MTTTQSDRDWRTYAYLDKENWPEAIPWTGPKREYGVYSWPPKSHHDPHDLDDYPTHHADAASVGHEYGGDVCPRCGVPLSNTETVVNKDGREGTIWDLARDDVTVPTYHKKCWKHRSAELSRLENKTFEDYL